MSMKSKETGKPVGNFKNRSDVRFLLPSLVFHLTETPEFIGGHGLFHLPCINRAERQTH